MEVFFNISNHPSGKWDLEQIEAAINLVGSGQIIDVPFPNVPPTASGQDCKKIATELFNKIFGGADKAGQEVVVMVQGEISVCHYLISMIKEVEAAKVVVATTHRVATETKLPDGSVEIKHLFKFVKFREI